jgi:hypothetical protein
MSQTPLNLDGTAFAAQEGANEVTSGMDRSTALVVRLIPFSIVWLVLACGLVWKLALERVDGFLIFGVLTALTYYAMDKNERSDSKHGVERHRIDKAAEVTLTIAAQDHELRREIVRAYIHHLEADSGHQRKLRD